MMTTPCQISKMPESSPRLLFAVEIAREAGQAILAMRSHMGLQVEQKADGTPVTQVDRNVEMLLRERIGQRFPDDGILGEELDTLQGSNQYQWVLDPIDGTKSFIREVPLYTTLVAILEGDEPLLGVIYAPVTDEMLYAQVGQGCWYCQGSGAPCSARVSQITDMREALLLTSDIESFTRDRSKDARAVYDQLASRCHLARTWGDAYGYLMVATGRAEIMIDPEMDLWDTAALQPILSEAGGSFTDWQGRPTIHSIDSIATNGALAEQVLSITRGW
jgi:histidinol-phosphatase